MDFFFQVVYVSGLTGQRYGAGAGHCGQGAGSHAFIDPGILLGGLHDHQQLPAIRAGDRVHPGIDLQGLLIWGQRTYDGLLL